MTPSSESLPLPLLLQLAQDIRISPAQAKAAIELLDSGATVPFIARYRKEATQNLDDVQLRELEARLSYQRELLARRQVVGKALAEMGKLTPQLQAAIDACDTKQALEDLYLPFKQKRRTKAQIAREAGLEPLADALLANPLLDPLVEADKYTRPLLPAAAGEDAPPDFSNTLLVLDGVRDLVSERWAQDPAIVAPVREWLWSDGFLWAQLAPGKNAEDPEVAKFRDYFDHDEPIADMPSHRALAVFRGWTLGVLDVALKTEEEIQALRDARDSQQPAPKLLPLGEVRLADAVKWRHQGRAADDFIKRCVSWTWRVKLALSAERELFSRLRETAEKVAIKIFADNVRDLLLAAPAGPKVVMGLDPGIRTGVKVAVIDATGKLVDTATVFPHEPRRDWQGALATLFALCRKHQVDLVAIGNGTASRETDKLASELLGLLETANAGTGSAERPGKVGKVMVSEAGASVYSASAYASEEMPDVDVSLRGAASIARRLQDPLAELVKIDPKSIGVGQYQHDVNQADLKRSLDAVVEDCVNQVGVDLNTASVPLLARVSGLSSTLARSLVRWRETHGAFDNRAQLLEVSGLGAKTFEQAAGFLRIRGGSNPLDMTGVHPESYPLVEHLLSKAGKPIEVAMGRSDVFKQIRPDMFADQGYGAITVQDVVKELEKPGRDPRPEFRVAQLDERIQSVADLKPGMVLEGTVSNVAAFGAFVDLGVHQDGLVHVSQLAHRFVNDAREVVKAGDVVKVQVLEVDAARQRIALSMKLGAAAGHGKSSTAPLAGTGSARARGTDGRGGPAGNGSSSRASSGRAPAGAPLSGAMASAFARLGR